MPSRQARLWPRSRPLVTSRRDFVLAKAVTASPSGPSVLQGATFRHNVRYSRTLFAANIRPPGTHGDEL